MSPSSPTHPVAPPRISSNIPATTKTSSFEPLHPSHPSPPSTTPRHLLLFADHLLSLQDLISRLGPALYPVHWATYIATWHNKQASAAACLAWCAVCLNPRATVVLVPHLAVLGYMWFWYTERLRRRIEGGGKTEKDNDASAPLPIPAPSFAEILSSMDSFINTTHNFLDSLDSLHARLRFESSSSSPSSTTPDQDSIILFQMILTSFAAWILINLIFPTSWIFMLSGLTLLCWNSEVGMAVREAVAEEHVKWVPSAKMKRVSCFFVNSKKGGGVDAAKARRSMQMSRLSMMFFDQSVRAYRGKAVRGEHAHGRPMSVVKKSKSGLAGDRSAARQSNIFATDGFGEEHVMNTPDSLNLPEKQSVETERKCTDTPRAESPSSITSHSTLVNSDHTDSLATPATSDIPHSHDHSHLDDNHSLSESIPEHPEESDEQSISPPQEIQDLSNSYPDDAHVSPSTPLRAVSPIWNRRPSQLSILTVLEDETPANPDNNHPGTYQQQTIRKLNAMLSDLERMATLSVTPSAGAGEHSMDLPYDDDGQAEKASWRWSVNTRLEDMEEEEKDTVNVESETLERYCSVRFSVAQVDEDPDYRNSVFERHQSVRFSVAQEEEDPDYRKSTFASFRRRHMSIYSDHDGDEYDEEREVFVVDDEDGYSYNDDVNEAEMDGEEYGEQYEQEYEGDEQPEDGDVDKASIMEFLANALREGQPNGEITEEYDDDDLDFEANESLIRRLNASIYGNPESATPSPIQQFSVLYPPRTSSRASSRRGSNDDTASDVESKEYVQSGPGSDETHEMSTNSSTPKDYHAEQRVSIMPSSALPPRSPAPGKMMIRPLDVVLTFETWENQRWWVGIGFAHQLLLNERPIWSNQSGTVSLPRESFVLFPFKEEQLRGARVPSLDTTTKQYKWEWDGMWTVSVEGSGIDEQGWEYGDTAWKDWSAKKTLMRVVRRRRWTRQARLYEFAEN
ncbi:hypothetical protein HK102_013778 [Quaeritorhiza haematococci]|nr:hypothetical protein HK102_013778 [Quaeritorhiza haematococci]